MPMPGSRVLTSSTGSTSPASRSSRPTARSTRATATVASRPIRWASRCDTGAKRPMHSTGTVVSRPATDELSPRSSWMVLTSGGTDASAARRFSAARKMATTSTAADGRPAVAVLVVEPTVREAMTHPSSQQARRVPVDARPAGDTARIRCPDGRRVPHRGRPRPVAQRGRPARAARARGAGGGRRSRRAPGGRRRQPDRPEQRGRVRALGRLVRGRPAGGGCRRAPGGARRRGGRAGPDRDGDHAGAGRGVGRRRPRPARRRQPRLPARGRRRAVRDHRGPRHARLPHPGARPGPGGRPRRRPRRVPARQPAAAVHRRAHQHGRRRRAWPSCSAAARPRRPATPWSRLRSRPAASTT